MTPKLHFCLIKNKMKPFISGVDVPQNYFKEVLENIEKNRLLSPLLVVTTLANCPTATLAVVRWALFHSG